LVYEPYQDRSFQLLLYFSEFLNYPYLAEESVSFQSLVSRKIKHTGVASATKYRSTTAFENLTERAIKSTRQQSKSTNYFEIKVDLPVVVASKLEESSGSSL
jgi:hypothetical protein